MYFLDARELINHELDPDDFEQSELEELEEMESWEREAYFAQKADEKFYYEEKQRIRKLMDEEECERIEERELIARNERERIANLYERFCNGEMDEEIAEENFI